MNSADYKQGFNDGFAMAVYLTPTRVKRVANGYEDDMQEGVRQIALRLPQALFDRVKERAIANGNSFAGEVRNVLASVTHPDDSSLPTDDNIPDEE